jgi:hypothetical protein
LVTFTKQTGTARTKKQSEDARFAASPDRRTQLLFALLTHETVRPLLKGAAALNLGSNLAAQREDLSQHADAVPKNVHL